MRVCPITPLTVDSAGLKPGIAKALRPVSYFGSLSMSMFYVLGLVGKVLDKSTIEQKDKFVQMLEQYVELIESEFEDGLNRAERAILDASRTQADRIRVIRLVRERVGTLSGAMDLVRAYYAKRNWTWV